MNKVVYNLIIIMALFLVASSGCININKNNQQFLILCENQDNSSHEINIIIYYDGVEIINITINAEPEAKSDLIRNDKLIDNIYIVKIIVDGKWSKSIDYKPGNSNFIVLNLGMTIDSYILFEKYKD